MTMTTRVFNFTLDPGDSLLHEVVVKNTDESIKDITGASVSYKIGNKGKNGAVVYQKSIGSGVTLTNPTLGVLQCALTADETAAFLPHHVYAYEIKLTIGSERKTVLEGTITTTGNVPT